jgi:hypothetical protein
MDDLCFLFISISYPKDRVLWPRCSGPSRFIKAELFLISWVTIDFSRKPPQYEFELSYICIEVWNHELYYDCESAPFNLAALPNSRQTHKADLRYPRHRGSILSRNLYQPTNKQTKQNNLHGLSPRANYTDQHSNYLWFVVLVSAFCSACVMRCVIWWRRTFVTNTELTSAFRWLVNRLC